jgi:beta-alanine--pyruvate transaminase
VTLHQIPNTIKTDSFWMPFTANRQFKKAPRLFSSAEGMHYTTVDGRKVIDGSAGLWCVNAGHGRKQIAAAVERQLMTLDFAPSFQMGHPLAFDFAERLAEIAPKGLDRIFFTNSGSESVDTALKIALAYHRANGQASRTRLIGRERGYHGVGFGGTSVGGMVANRRAFATLLPGVDHIRHTHDLTRNAFAKDQPGMAPSSPTTSSVWSRCTAPRPSPPSSSSRCPVRPRCCRRRRVISTACARSATSTASC